ncbi:class I SAM-dependent methyltransferase [Nocardia asteroides]|uniref:class I SAM-dependent methyltransferase n=1 Tax=Nocardia asteroides TaxID=1824 RepID=UPI001E3904CC|nr:methyltransferase domain-containing protein [Nocardia asteroides]UGT62774.1 methyltransferase C-terminal domain-containing protein [Nocardia asteroides]
MSTCLACGGAVLTRVLDLGRMPAADHFPPASEPVRADEAAHPLAMALCAACGLAQLAADDTETAEPRGVEPRALREQAAEAVALAAEAGLLRGRTVREFGSPHGGSWLELLAARGFAPATAPADVVLDCFGLMHERDQRAAVAERAAATAPGGVLLVQYHPVHTIVAGEQWNALRHGHFAYYSLAVLRAMLGAAGMSVVTAWDFGLYGGTVLIAAVHGPAEPDAAVRRVLAREVGSADPAFVGGLQRAADRQRETLRAALELEAARGARVYAYGAASRAVALFCRAGVRRELVAGVADASPAKQGRRMPGTDVPIIAPAELVAARPDRVLLTVPDLLAEVSERYPELTGRWLVGEPATSNGEPPIR